MILEPQHVLELQCELEEHITTREGMIAENQQRQHLGQSMAFGDVEFDSLATKIKALRERIIRYGES